MRSLFALTVLIPGLALADAAEIASRLDELYVRRDDPAVAKETEALISQALKEHPEEYGVLWRASRYRWWLADGATDPRRKKQLGKESWDLAEKAVRANPKAVEGHYFAATGIGAYSQAVGILKALGEGLEGKFNERLEKSISLNVDFDIGGPMVTKGRYHYELPWPKRDLGKSKAELEKVIKKFPQNLRAHLYLAETLLKDGEAQKAKESITRVQQGDGSYDPPEARRIKHLAKSVAAQIEEELK